MGLPFMVLKSGLGTDIQKTIGKDKARELECPFTGERLMAYAAVRPDFTIIHVQRVDTEGNCAHRRSSVRQCREGKIGYEPDRHMRGNSNFRMSSGALPRRR